MQVSSRERWPLFLAWLGSNVSGIHPFTLGFTLGPIIVLLPVARQVASEITLWLLALLAERQRLGLAPRAPCPPALTRTLDRDSRQQPCRRQEAQYNPRWLGWLLVAEFLRLARLAEAPETAFYRRDWLAWEVRYWALAVSLARIGQLYAALARRQGSEAAMLALETVLAVAWSQALADDKPVQSAASFAGASSR